VATAADPATATKALQTGNVEISEDASNYTITIANSSAQRTGIRTEGQTLRLTSQDPGTGVRMEQSLSLPQSDPSQSVQMSQDKDKLVLTVPKLGTSSPSTASTRQLQARPSQPALSPAPRDVDSMAATFERMQRQMAQMMNQAMAGFDDNGPTLGMPTMPSLAGFGGASVDIKDMGKSYVVRAKVPGSAAQNVSVSVDNERVLKISAKDESSGSNRYQMANFSQVFTLPGPVDSSKMKVENENDSLVITLPKA
jgi:HSP20 family molecular chaperone IbpA